MQCTRPLTYLLLPLKQCARAATWPWPGERVPCAVLRTNQSIWLRLPRNARDSPPLDSGLTRRCCSKLLSHVACLRQFASLPRPSIYWGPPGAGLLLRRVLCRFSWPLKFSSQIRTIIIAAC
ncbi:hypothetical protein F5B18DRAFT_346802 [Nemania serpens]|nr:hypothetical protein F5B18DRAFT_346802 [Nemania serpens]